jgi:hypothetical protein
MADLHRSGCAGARRPCRRDRHRAGAAQTPASLREWLFSDPYLRVPRLLLGFREGPGAVELEHLGGNEPVAVRGPGQVADYLRGTYSGLNLQITDSDREALRRVLSQEASYAVVDEAHLARLSREAEFADFRVLADIGYPQLLRLATRRDLPQLAGILDAALRALPVKDLDRLHEHWLQPQYPRLGQSPGFWQNLCLLLGLLLLRPGHRDLAAPPAQCLEQACSPRGATSRCARPPRALRLTQFAIDSSTVGILWVNWDSHMRYANRAAEACSATPPARSSSGRCRTSSQGWTWTAG